MSDISQSVLDKVLQTVRDCWKVRDSDAVELAPNGWPTTRQVADVSDLSQSHLSRALCVLESDGSVVRADQTMPGQVGGPMGTVAPADATDVSEDDDGPEVRRYV